jgi:DNA-binding transcriptional regulator YhcF (GntR family)
MMEHIRIDKRSGVPVYQQLTEGISGMVSSGNLKPGDRLPAERDLAAHLKVARGTVKKAMSLLVKQGVVASSHGVGHTIINAPLREQDSRIARAAVVIEEMLKGLEELNFSFFEMSNLISLKMAEHEERRQQFFIAIADCNPESLANFEKQLKQATRVSVSTFLIGDLRESPEPGKKLEHFNVIVTTSNHYAEIRALLPTLRDRIMQVYVAPTAESMVELATIRPSHKVGVLCTSFKFLQIIKARLAAFAVTESRMCHAFLEELTDPDAFAKDCDVLIVPPNFSAQGNRELFGALQRFMERGGRVITFNYEIEKGSLLHVEERMNWLLRSRKDAQ